MHNDPVRGFTTVDVPTPFDLLALDKQQTKLVNGDDGGSWSPSYPIVIGGAGVQIGGPTQFSAARGVSDNTAVIALNPNGTVVSGGVFDGAAGAVFNAQASSRVEFQAGSLGQVGSATFLSASQLALGSVVGKANWVGLTATLPSTWAISFGATGVLSLETGSSWTSSGSVTFSGTVVYGITSPGIARTGAWTLSGSGAVTGWRYAASDDDNATYDTSVDHYIVPDLSDVRTYRLKSPPAGTLDGARITFSCLVHGTMPKVTFRRADGATVATTPTAGPWWITFEWNAVNAIWRTHAWYSGDTNTRSQS